MFHIVSTSNETNEVVKIARDICVDIGGGYEMDDFQMELILS
jgi:hypothetical protein